MKMEMLGFTVTSAISFVTHGITQKRTYYIHDSAKA